MTCPNYEYLGFGHVERCRNCGYDFSLSSSSNVPDLAMRPSTPNTPQPLADLAFDSGLPLAAMVRVHGSTPELGPGRAVATTEPTPELPLFGSSTVDDVPLITRPSPP